MENYVGTVVNCVFVLCAVVIFVGIILRVLKDRFSHEKSAKATVVDKNTFRDRALLFHQAPHTTHRYVVTFDLNGKRMRFYVSELSYQSYKIGDKGTLVYKGLRLIDFKQNGVQKSEK